MFLQALCREKEGGWRWETGWNSDLAPLKKEDEKNQEITLELST